MASLYPLSREFFYRLGTALRDKRLGVQLRDFLNHSGERTVQALIAGGAAGAHAVAGITDIDRIISVYEQDAASGILTDLTGEFTVTADDTIDNTGGTDTSGDTLLVTYGDRAA